MANGADRPGEESSEAFLLIQGTDFEVYSEFLDTFIDGVRDAAENPRVSGGGEVQAGEYSGRRIDLEADTGSGITRWSVDLFEGYWADLAPKMTNEGPLAKLFAGLTLFFAWVPALFSTRIHKRSPAMALGILATGAVLLVWYVGVVGVGLGSLAEVLANQVDVSIAESERRAKADLGQNEDAEADSTGIAPDSGEELPRQTSANKMEFRASWLYSAMRTISDQAALLYLWLGSIGLMAFVPVDKVVNRTFTVRKFIKPTNESERRRIRERIRRRLIAICEQPHYQRITIVAHGFGTIVAVDLLADFMKSKYGDKQIDLVTLGSPAGLVCTLSTWAKMEFGKLKTGSEQVPEVWKDYHLNGDWSSSPVLASGVVTEGVDIHGEQDTHGLELWDVLRLRAHRRYWESQIIAEDLLMGNRSADS